MHLVRMSSCLNQYLTLCWNYEHACRVELFADLNNFAISIYRCVSSEYDKSSCNYSDEAGVVNTKGVHRYLLRLFIVIKCASLSRIEDCSHADKNLKYHLNKKPDSSPSHS